MRRTQALAAAIVALLLVGGAAYADRELEPAELGAAPAASADSGEWFCPHGGGEEGWEVLLQVANPGERAATIRVRTLGRQRPTEPETITVEPGSFLRIPVPAEGRERATSVEWFDQWVAVGWIAHAGGEEGGVAAEPCAPAAGDRWILPDGTTETDANDDAIVVMNPFARDAVFSAVLLSERHDPVVQGELTDLVLRPFHSRLIRLNDVVKGERTVSTLIDVSVGRVVAASLGVTVGGGIRSSIGYLDAPPLAVTLPGGADAGRTDLALANTGTQRSGVDAVLLEKEQEAGFAGLADAAPPPETARTFPSTTTGPTTVVLTGEGPGLAASRRTFGVVSDQASTGGAAPADAWLVLPAASGTPAHPGLALANPGSEPAEVTLSYLAQDAGQEVVVVVPPRRTVMAPKAFIEAAPQGAVLAEASTGTFVPASASYSLGREGFATYAVALGIPIPSGWVLR
ncbi:MAG: hypothetical protein ACXWX9_09570 [Actinomycetota bacterium]